MRVREIKLADGRYLIFYTFDDEGLGGEAQLVSLEGEEKNDVGTPVEPPAR